MSIAQELSEKILHIVEKNPICQSDLVHTLNIKHDQRIAEAVKILLNEHKVSRIKKGHTYLISLNGNHEKTSKIINFDILLNNDTFSPCCGCNNECVPSECLKLNKWIG